MEKVVRVCLDDIRVLHSKKASLVDPLARLIDLDCGPRTDHGRSVVDSLGFDPNNGRRLVCNKLDKLLLIHWIRGELFHHDIDPYLVDHQYKGGGAMLGKAVQKSFSDYCTLYLGSDAFGPVFGKHVARTFDKRWRNLLQFSRNGCWEEDEEVSTLNTWHLDESERLFIAVARSLGEDSLAMLLPGGMERCKKRLEVAKAGFAAMDDRVLDTTRDWLSSSTFARGPPWIDR